MPTLKWLKSEWNYYYFKDAPVHISSINLNKNSIVFTEAWQAEQLTATINPSEAIEKKIHWSSSDITVATVSQTGLITCVTPGNCTITAECSWITATCVVIKKKDIVVDLLVLAWWGWGWKWWSMTQWGWGWAGWLIYCLSTIIVPSASNSITVWAWWWPWCKWCNSSFLSYTAIWWWNWSDYLTWWTWGSWWWAVWTYSDMGSWWAWTEWQWYNWWWGWYSNQTWAWTWWGWGWAWWAWCSAFTNSWWTWGIWIITDITGTELCMAWGWGWAWYYWWAAWSYWWGNWWQQSRWDASYWLWKNATTYWSWGWGWGWCCSWNWWSWCQWIVVVRYLTACWYNASWWCKYTCGNYTIHCFTSNGTLCFVQDWTLNMN